MLYRFISYIGFIFSSTNQHGVHSPFIYNFVTKCLYRKSKYKGRKTIKTLLKSITYFNAVHISVLPEDGPLIELIRESFPQTKFNAPSDLIYMGTPCATQFTRILKGKSYHNDTILLIDKIYGNKNNTQEWEAFKKHEKVTVSVDMFSCGALFFRKEQAKEHFKIRI